MAKITISVEIVDAEFRKDFQIDPADPLTELVRRIAEEEGFPLRTASGRPIAWTVEGPNWRPGKDGRTDLVRTQSLEKITQRFLDEGGPKTPLFEIALEIPGAPEAIRERRAEQKLEDIDSTLDQRRQERLDDMGTAADFTMDTAERMAYEEPPTPPPLPQPKPKPKPKPVEQRIRRAKRPPPDNPGPDQRLLFAFGGVGCFLLLIIIGVMITLKMRSDPAPPEPPPTPVVVVPEPAPVAVPVAPEPPPKKKRSSRVPMEVFFKKSNITRSSASAASAQLTSFGKEEINLSYVIRQTGAGSHTVALKGRFRVTISDSGGAIETSGERLISRGAAIGEDTRVTITNLNGVVSVKMGGKRYGPYKIKKSGSFAAWQISISSAVTLLNLKASAQAE